MLGVNSVKDSLIDFLAKVAPAGAGFVTEEAKDVSLGRTAQRGTRSMMLARLSISNRGPCPRAKVERAYLCMGRGDERKATSNETAPKAPMEATRA